jgi:peptidyl-prolyl cis-trans isomerase A (cyclophilin A)
MKFLYKNPLLLIVIISFTFAAQAQIVRMETVLGNIDIELNPDVAPNTVANFLNYVNDGDYDNSFFHRSITNFIVQGGSFNLINDVFGEVPLDGPVTNEFNLLNKRGTIAMAKLDSQPDSATSGWFFNTTDNPDLDTQNGGFTVFGTVVNGMDVVDNIGAQQLWNAGGPLASIPLIDFPNNGETINDYLVLVSRVFVLDGSLNFNAGLGGAWFNADTSGSGILLEVLPTANVVFMAWFTHDAQTPVEGVANTIGSTNQRWLTGIGTIDHENNSVTLDLANTSGGLFDNPQDVTNSAPNSYGTMTISFDDCSHANVVYNLIDQELSGSFPMGRISQDNVALCESLSQAAAQ